MKALAALSLLILVPGAASDPLVSGFATDLPARESDDAFELWNPTSTSLALDVLLVKDGEGELRFPAGSVLAPHARVRVALQYNDYARAARAAPDYALDHPEVERRAVATERFLLAQSRDELWVERNGVVLDAVAWGPGEHQGPGWNGPRVPVEGNTTLRWWSRADDRDTDRADDWVRPQRERLGWRARETPPADQGPATAYTAPDRSRDQVLSFIQGAQRSLRLNVYELRDPGVARELLGALARRPDLELSVLVDETPVGLEAEERLLRDRILRELEAAGARVRLITHHRYGFDHAKYLVADEARILVQSENLVPSGVPADGASGNRGWGLVLETPRLARWLAEAFDRDFQLDPFGSRELGPRERGDVPLPAPHDVRAAPRLGVATDVVNATLLLGPESNLGPDDVVLATLRGARQEILLQQLRVPPRWRDVSGNDWAHAYLDAIVEAAHRGVRVRILLDGSFEDGGELDNAATVDWLEDRRGAADLEARLWIPPAGVLHNKGLVVDGRYAFVGSMNWNLQSVAQNREILVRAESATIAAFFRDAFQRDWEEGLASKDRFTPIPSATLMLIALFATACLLRSHLPP